MYKLIGIGNPGFSFTYTYLNNILNLIDEVEKCKNRTDITYPKFQELLKDPSRIRMIVPFLRDIGIISDENFTNKLQCINFKSFYTELSKPFLLFMEIYRYLNLDDEIACYKTMNVFRSVMHGYFDTLSSKKVEYKIIYNYLKEFKTIDKFEFFVITTFEMNGITDIAGYTNAKDLINEYRNGNIKVSNYEYSSNVNSYSYIMQILCDFDICIKLKNSYQIKEEK